MRSRLFVRGVEMALQVSVPQQETGNRVQEVPCNNVDLVSVSIWRGQLD